MKRQGSLAVAHHLYACLPFVELAQEKSFELGPVAFWPSSKIEEFLGSKAPDFQEYIETISQIKAPSNEQKTRFVKTKTLIPASTTCVSIDERIPVELREFVLIDALYLLYFACTFRNLYYGQEMPSFNAFRKMIPASLEFIESKKNWQNLHIEEAYREETVCVHLVDTNMCKGLGQALQAIYTLPVSHHQAQEQAYKRLIRSIRYLVDRFFPRFINLFNQGLSFSSELFEPEDILFLASSFEALFNINDKHPAADFKYKLRPLLHLKYEGPVELFWKWVDDFYQAKRRLIHGDYALDPIFRLNPNFAVSHLLIGIKLFVYSVYYSLFKLELLPSTHVDSYTPPDFKWIHPEEILLFFWTESNLLRKLNMFFKQAQQESKIEEIQADLQLLSSLFVSMHDRYFKENASNVTFIPTPKEELAVHGLHLLEKIEAESHKRAKGNSLLKFLHPRFVQVLKLRLQ